MPISTAVEAVPVVAERVARAREERDPQDRGEVAEEEDPEAAADEPAMELAAPQGRGARPGGAQGRRLGDRLCIGETGPLGPRAGYGTGKHSFPGRQEERTAKML